MVRSEAVAFVLAGLVTWFSAQLRAPEWSGHVPEQRETEFTMAIELEKTRFLQGEQILVWMVTELASGERRPIPGHAQRLIYTRPDGTTRVGRKPVRIDGWETPDYGSRYGHRLERETPQLGRWSVVFEMGDRRTEPAEFTVEAPGPIKGIDAHFEFNTPQIFDPGATATLVVRNGSPLVLRVVHPGRNWSRVHGQVRVASRVGLFEVPWDALVRAAGTEPRGFLVERLGWATIDRLPHATIAPGATWRLLIPFSRWLPFGYSHLRPAGEVSISTELQIFLGEPDSEWRGVSPVRWIATGKTSVEK